MGEHRILLSEMSVDLSTDKTQHSLQNRVARAVWAIFWIVLFRPSPKVFHGWRRFLLRLFGAQIGHRAYVYPSVRIWAPWNLEMKDYSCLSHFVDCYSVDRIKIGTNTTVSQYSFLCTASHDITKSTMPLITAPIELGDSVWITADVYIGPGVTIGEGSVVAVKSCVINDVPPWSISGGIPARVIGPRVISNEGK
jgi:putative colanic acid biosynthesis acetyltransferase WcaF